MPFTKVESAGNDFVLVHLDELASEELPGFAIQVSRRSFSIGSDGLLAVGTQADKIVLRMFNPDGTEDFCGNGLRCTALYAYENGWTDAHPVIAHGGRLIPTHVMEGGRVRSELQPAGFLPESVPLRRGTPELFRSPIEVLGRRIEVSAVTTGSTHTVILVDELPGDEEFLLLGPAIEHHPLFPERTSVIWAKIVDDENLKIRIWERGAGETQGCGTGSSAAAAVFFRARGRHGTVTVHNPGGPVAVTMDEWDAPMATEAVARILFRGRIPFEAKMPPVRQALIPTPMA